MEKGRKRKHEPLTNHQDKQSRFIAAARRDYLSWCKIHHLKTASTKNLYWYCAQIAPSEQRALVGSVSGDADCDNGMQNLGGGWMQDLIDGIVSHPDHQSTVRSGPKGFVVFHDDHGTDRSGPFGALQDAIGHILSNPLPGAALSGDGDAEEHVVGPITKTVEVVSEDPNHDAPDKGEHYKDDRDQRMASKIRRRAIGDQMALDPNYAPKDYQINTPGLKRGTKAARRVASTPSPPPGTLNRGTHRTSWLGWGPSVFPKVRKVSGWEFDDHLNGYLANHPHKFACECNREFDTPTGFHRCKCGRQYNSYVIGSSGGNNHHAAADKFIVREVPVRPEGNVIVAKRHDLTSPGELDEGKDEELPTMKDSPKDWAKRDRNQRWVKVMAGRRDG